MPPTSALMSRISGASRWRREKAGEIADFVPPIQRIHPRLERSGDVAACRYQVLRRLDGPKLLLAQSEDAVGLKLELQVGDRLCELRAQSRRDPREQIRKLTAGALEGVTEHAHLIEARRLGSEQQVAEGRACQPLRIQWRSLGAGSVRSITAATPARVSNHEVSVFADDDTILAARQRGDVGIPRPILLGQVERMQNIVPACVQPARQSSRQLRIDDEPHAANGSMRLVCVTRAAKARAARMSSRVRSS